MELTSRHKAYFLVLGLAGSALGVDRFLLSGEATSPSKASATTPALNTAEPTPTTSSPAPTSPKPTLAARMDALAAADDNASPTEAGNAFVPEWDLGVKQPPADDPGPATRQSIKWLRLTSVVPGRAAVLNGTVVFVGKEVAVPADPEDHTPRTSGSDTRRATRTITLVRAEERRVVVRIGEEEHVLSLPDRAELQKLRPIEDRGLLADPADSGDPR